MKVGWYYHRLKAMTVSELAHRVADRWKHRSDASFPESLRSIELGAPAGDVIMLPSRDAAPETLKKVLARDAAALIHGDWKIFGWREVNVGTPPRWHRDAAAGVDIAPQGLAHQLDHRTLPDGADARTVWEINRWSEMVRLAMHGWMNGDPGAVRVAMQWLEDWCDKNPVGYDINWTSPLEAALRLTNFVWFDALVEGSLCALQRVQSENDEVRNALRRAQQALAGRIVPAHAAWVWRYLSFGSSANNHLLGELVGLLHAVKRWPALERVVCPAEQLWRKISRCVLEQFAKDGGNREQALHYHLFAWEMAWHAAKLMRVTNGPVKERLDKAAEFFVHMAHEGEQWEFGDNDDAQIVPLTLGREHAVAEWRAWMRGAKGSLGFWVGRFRDDPGKLAGNNSTNVKSCWWVAHESGMAACEQNGWKLRLDASPLGFGTMAAHGHCDALHVSIWDGPDALIIDPGTGGYFGARELRAELASWESHNGPHPVEGFTTPRRMGPFLWMEHHATPELILQGDEIYARLAHDGYEFSRTVSFVDGAKHVVVCDLECNKRPFKVRWHFSPDCEVHMPDPLVAVFEISRGGQRWSMSVMPGADDSRVTVSAGKSSRCFGQVGTCPTVEIVAQGSLRTEWHRT